MAGLLASCSHIRARAPAAGKAAPDKAAPAAGGRLVGLVLAHARARARTLCTNTNTPPPPPPPKNKKSRRRLADAAAHERARTRGTAARAQVSSKAPRCWWSRSSTAVCVDGACKRCCAGAALEASFKLWRGTATAAVVGGRLQSAAVLLTCWRCPSSAAVLVAQQPQQCLEDAFKALQCWWRGSGLALEHACKPQCAGGVLQAPLCC